MNADLKSAIATAKTISSNIDKVIKYHAAMVDALNDLSDAGVSLSGLLVSLKDGEVTTASARGARKVTEEPRAPKISRRGVTAEEPAEPAPHSRRATAPAPVEAEPEFDGQPYTAVEDDQRKAAAKRVRAAKADDPKLYKAAQEFFGEAIEDDDTLFLDYYDGKYMLFTDDDTLLELNGGAEEEVTTASARKPKEAPEEAEIDISPAAAAKRVKAAKREDADSYDEALEKYAAKLNADTHYLDYDNELEKYLLRKHVAPASAPVKVTRAPKPEPVEVVIPKSIPRSKHQSYIATAEKYAAEIAEGKFRIIYNEDSDKLQVVRVKAAAAETAPVRAAATTRRAARD